MAKKKGIKNAPSLPPEAAGWTKDQLGEDLLQTIYLNLAPCVDADLLPRQTASCVGGIGSIRDLLAKASVDEDAQRYQQIWDDYMGDAENQFVDCLQVYFVACQIYVTRVVEAVRWVGEYAGNHLPDNFRDASAIWNIGLTIPGQSMTVAWAIRHLGNFAKHHAELEGLSAQTESGLLTLGVMAEDGTIASGAETRGVAAIAGHPIGSLDDAENGVRTVERRVKEWADHLVREIVIPEVDERRCGDRSRTKKENERNRKIFAPFLERESG